MRTAAFWIALFAALGFAGGASAEPKASDCKEAIQQSRMVCLSGNDCQKEISRILQSCTSGRPSCRKARDALRTRCAPRQRWEGTRECEDAIDQLRLNCVRERT